MKVILLGAPTETEKRRAMRDKRICSKYADLRKAYPDYPDSRLFAFIADAEQVTTTTIRKVLKTNKVI